MLTCSWPADVLLGKCGLLPVPWLNSDLLAYFECYCSTVLAFNTLKLLSWSSKWAKWEFNPDALYVIFPNRELGVRVMSGMRQLPAALSQQAQESMSICTI